MTLTSRMEFIKVEGNDEGAATYNVRFLAGTDGCGDRATFEAPTEDGWSFDGAFLCRLSR